jgi:hypothetical protein
MPSIVLADRECARRFDGIEQAMQDPCDRRKAECARQRRRGAVPGQVRQHHLARGELFGERSPLGMRERHPVQQEQHGPAATEAVADGHTIHDGVARFEARRRGITEHGIRHVVA